MCLRVCSKAFFLFTLKTLLVCESAVTVTWRSEDSFATSELSFAQTWFLGAQFRLSGFETGTFSCGAIVLDLYFMFWDKAFHWRKCKVLYLSRQAAGESLALHGECLSYEAVSLPFLHKIYIISPIFFLSVCLPVDNLEELVLSFQHVNTFWGSEHAYAFVHWVASSQPFFSFSDEGSHIKPHY